MKQWPHEIWNGMTTRSPTLQFVTSGPTASTIPIGSWPRMSPSPLNGPITPYRGRAEPQIAVLVMRTSASVGCWIVGSGTLSTRTSRFPCHATALMLALLSRLRSEPYPGSWRRETSVARFRAGIGANVGNYLGTYLNDHLAGATIGRELSRRAAGENRGTPLGDFLEKLHEEIADDRQTLLDVMDALDVGEDHVKTIAARVGERIGRLKPNGNLLSYSPLSRVVELEGLALGVTGKQGLWRALGLAEDPRLE